MLINQVNDSNGVTIRYPGQGGLGVSCDDKLMISCPSPNQNTNVYHMVVQCSQMFANIKHSITTFNENLFDVCEDSSKCEKRLCLAG